MSDDIDRQVIEILARKKKVDAAAITRDTTFEALGMDSLDAADLLFTVEEAFDVAVPDDAAKSMRSVGQVIDGIRQLKTAGGAA